MPEINLDWNFVIEIMLGVILYKIVDSTFDVFGRLALKAVRKVMEDFRKTN